MPNEKYQDLNLFYVKLEVQRYANQSRPLQYASAAESVVEDGETYSNFRNPRPHISITCIEDQGLAEYMSQIGTVIIKNAPFDTFPFEPEHPKSTTHRQ